jgi:hypothetical protein
VTAPDDELASELTAHLVDEVRRAAAAQPSPGLLERALNLAEILGATFACLVLVTAPVWVALVADELGASFELVFVPMFLALIVLPAVVRTKRTRELDGYRRWGANLGWLLGTPLRVARARARRRRLKLVGAGATSTVVRALDEDGR